MKFFDGHNDILNKITNTYDPLNARAFLKSGAGQLDFPRAQSAGFMGGFFAVYPSNPPPVPSSEDRTILTDDGYHVIMAPPLSYEYAHQSALKMIDLLQKVLDTSSADDLAASICVVDRRRVRFRRLPVD